MYKEVDILSDIISGINIPMLDRPDKPDGTRVTSFRGRYGGGSKIF